MTLPTDPKERKNVPMARGLLDYFPDALATVADVSRVGNEQHNPGQPMHWEKGLSTDHADCIVRHLVDRGSLDSDGLRHTAKVAWRALALLQTELEEAARLNKPIVREIDILSRMPDDDCDPCATLNFVHCDNCHSLVCEFMGACMRKVDDLH